MKGIRSKNAKKILISIFILLSIILLIVVGYIANFVYSNNEYYKNEKNIQIPIFVYHNIVDEITEPEYMQTTKENFIKQITGLRKLGYDVIRYDDLISYYNGEKKLKEKSLLITLDDGWEGNYTNLFPIAKEYNIPVSINVIDSNIGTEKYMTWEQIKEMSDSGIVDIYSHSRYHRNPKNVSTEEYVNDVKYAHKHLEEKLEKKVTKVFTYPYGIYDEDKINALNKEGFFIQNLTDNKVNKSNNLDMLRLHREYPLNDSIEKILLKTVYRSIKYN